MRGPDELGNWGERAGIMTRKLQGTESGSNMVKAREMESRDEHVKARVRRYKPGFQVNEF